MRADEFLKKYGLDGDDDDLKDTSLRGKSLERALHPGMPHAGTPPRLGGLGTLSRRGKGRSSGQG